MSNPESSSLEETLQPLAHYWTAHTLRMTDVAWKIRRKSVYESSDFFCRHDPHPPIFSVKVQLGEEFVSFFVNARSDRTFRISQMNLKLIGDKGLIVNKRSSLNSGFLTFGESWGWTQFYQLKPEDAEEAMSWKFVCGFGYQVSPPAEARLVKASDGSGRDSALHDDLLHSLETTPNGDVTFVVQGDEIKGHKDILSARCDYFQRMFASEMRENVTNEVIVPDVEPDVFRAMLRYLYSDTLSPKDFAEISLDLLVAADKYGVETLKRKCQLDAPVNVDNVVDALVVAESIDAETLMTRAKIVFGANFDVLMQSERTKAELSKNLLFELLSHFIRE